MVALLCVGSAINYADRVNISIAVVDMSRAFGWDMRVQAVVLSCFFWGYLCSQVVGALLAQRYGGKLILGAAALCWSVLTCLTPAAAASGSFALLVLCRVALGAAEGFLIPVNSHLVAAWVPEGERGRALTAIQTGCHVGTLCAFTFSPQIMVGYGWPWCFYVFGSVGFVWCGIWACFGADKQQRKVVGPGVMLLHREGRGGGGAWPSTRARLAYGEGSIVQQLWEQAAMAKRMASSKAVWAITLSHYSANVGNYVGLAWFPTYFHQQWGIERGDLGVTMVPYLCVLPMTIATGILADRVVAKVHVHPCQLRALHPCVARVAWLPRPRSRVNRTLILGVRAAEEEAPPERGSGGGGLGAALNPQALRKRPIRPFCVTPQPVHTCL